MERYNKNKQAHEWSLAQLDEPSLGLWARMRASEREITGYLFGAMCQTAKRKMNHRPQ